MSQVIVIYQTLEILYLITKMYCIMYVLYGIDVCFEMNVHGNNQKEMTWKICN